MLNFNAIVNLATSTKNEALRRQYEKLKSEITKIQEKLLNELTKMKKYLAAAISLAIIVSIIVSAIAVTQFRTPSSRQFYVGVTYGGESVIEAQQLIDKVKDYTNVFVLTSGTLMENLTAMELIGDYAVNAGLKIILYYGTNAFVRVTCYSMINLGQERWNSSFLGLYFNDEPCGKMLDGKAVYLYREGTNNGTIYRYPDGSVEVGMRFDNQGNSTNTQTRFFSSGEIQLRIGINITPQVSNETTDKTGSINPISSSSYSQKIIEYKLNGTITCMFMNEDSEGKVVVRNYVYQPDGIVLDINGTIVTDQGDISQFEPYQQLLDSNPFKINNEVADTFLEIKQTFINKLQNQTVKLFTSDFALYWFDYKIGYNTVFAQFVGNESRSRHIALCRGAAEAFSQDWGAIITWKYDQEPYLESGEELYNDLVTAYGAGAKYSLVFSYPNVTQYGTLTDDHFDTLEKFWNTLKSNPESLNVNKVTAAYVVPADYGFGFRSSSDTIWGLFPADNLSEKIFQDTLTLTEKYGANYDILYDDPEINLKLDKYTTVYYYNQTVT